MKPELKIILGAALFSFIPIAVLIGGQSGVFSLLLGRMVVAVCVLWMIARSGVLFSRDFFKGFYKLLLWSFFMSVAMVSYFFSIKLTGIAISSALLGTQPLFVIFLTLIFVKQNLPRFIWTAGGLTLLGIVLISLQESSDQNSSWIGMCLALLSSFLLAVIFIFQKIKLSEFTGKQLVFYQSLLQIPMILPFCFNENVLFNLNFFIAILILGIICTVMAYSLIFDGIKKVNAEKIGILQSTEYVLPALFGILFFKDAQVFLTITGIVLILFSCVLIHIENKYV